jgi:hypothetical protein
MSGETKPRIKQLWGRYNGRLPVWAFPSPATSITGEAQERVRATSAGSHHRRLSDPRPYYSPSPPLTL